MREQRVCMPWLGLTYGKASLMDLILSEDRRSPLPDRRCSPHLGLLHKRLSKQENGSFRSPYPTRTTWKAPPLLVCHILSFQLQLTRTFHYEDHIASTTPPTTPPMIQYSTIVHFQLNHLFHFRHTSHSTTTLTPTLSSSPKLITFPLRAMGSGMGRMERTPSQSSKNCQIQCCAGRLDSKMYTIRAPNSSSR